MPKSDSIIFLLLLGVHVYNKWQSISSVSGFGRMGLHRAQQFGTCYTRTHKSV